MNKKLIYVFAVLVAGLFVVSACNLINQDEVGVRITKKNNNNLIIKSGNVKTLGGTVEGGSCSCSDNGVCHPQTRERIISRDPLVIELYTECTSSSSMPCGSCESTGTPSFSSY